MKKFRIIPEICMAETTDEFIKEFSLSKEDLIFTGEATKKFLEGKLNGAHLVLRETYGSGEPTDTLVEKIHDDIKEIPYKRVIAIGGGTIMDVAKLLALKNFSPVLDLYDKKFAPQKEKELILIPTTCGTGSEVTNISILELTARKTKLGLAEDNLFADKTVLIPELLKDLPYKFFATSAIDAFVHATESFLSPKATPFSRQFSIKSLEMILKGFMKIKEGGKDARIPLLNDFLLASTFAGIAFGNAGTGAVHAMSYSFGAKYHVPHGESNYVLYTAVFDEYNRQNPGGDIALLNEKTAAILGCKKENACTELAALLNEIIPLKPMSAYGATESDISAFTENTMTKQGRLTANNYVPLNAAQVESIYRSVL